MPLAGLRRVLRLLVVLAVALAAAPPARAGDAAMRAPAGYVVAVETTASDPDQAAHILREDQEVSLQIGGALFDGDAVVVREAGSAVIIETVGDRRLRVDAARSPHPIKGELPQGGRFSALAAMVGELFTARPEARTVNLIGRDDPALRLRLGRDAAQKVVPGTRLWIGWQGGVAPYTVEIRRRGEGAVLAAASATGRSAALLLPATASGPLALSVSDASGDEAEIALVASPAPPIPSWIGEGAPTAEFGQVASALWLVAQTPPEWDLQAAALAAAAPGYPAAEALLRRLADGQRPAR